MTGSVLVVDDAPVFRGLARRMLTDSGLVVAGEAETADTAVAADNGVYLMRSGVPTGVSA
jgi:CheY-like chemotaxis protein